jgi:hypothetical protein
MFHNKFFMIRAQNYSFWINSYHFNPSVCQINNFLNIEYFASLSFR